MIVPGAGEKYFVLCGEPILMMVKNPKSYYSLIVTRFLVETTTDAKRALMIIEKTRPNHGQQCRATLRSFPRAIPPMDEYENHPTQSPALLKRSYWPSNPSDTVLDPSRAVTIAAPSQRRQVVKAIGIELNNEYVKMVAQKIERHFALFRK